MGGISERSKEIRRRRKRRIKLNRIKSKLPKASASVKAHWAEQIRRMTTGGELIIAQLGLEERK